MTNVNRTLHTTSLAAALILSVSLFNPPTAAAQAAAQQPPAAAISGLPPDVEAFTLTPFIGAGFAGDLENTPADFGLALGYGANRWISLEGELSLAPSVTQGEVLQFDTNYWSLSGNVLYHFFQPQFTPYVTLGLGVVGSNPDLDLSGILGDEDSSTTSFAWNYGTGIKAAFSDRIGIRGDLRYFNAREVAPDHFRIYAGLVIRRIGR